MTSDSPVWVTPVRYRLALERLLSRTIYALTSTVPMVVNSACSLHRM